MIYKREDLEQKKDYRELNAIAEQRGLLADFNAVDEHVLIDLILDSQEEDLKAEVKECEDREREEGDTTQTHTIAGE